MEPQAHTSTMSFNLTQLNWQYGTLLHAAYKKGNAVVAKYKIVTSFSLSPPPLLYIDYVLLTYFSHGLQYAGYRPKILVANYFTFFRGNDHEFFFLKCISYSKVTIVKFEIMISNTVVQSSFIGLVRTK